MASSSFSSAPPPTWRYKVFTSFHGPDVRKTFLSHLRKQFKFNGISMFDDQGIERGQTIAPALTQAIKESRIAILVLSKNYASSRWCLDELLEIFKCKETMGQIVMTVFYGVDPSDVRNQTGEFGSIFKKTCGRKKEEVKGKWSQALKDAGNIAGEDFQNWEKESEMIEKIARDVSKKLNVAVSWDFENMVGIEAHLQKMLSLLHIDYEDESMIVGICGPAGIGKTTIAWALHSRLSSSFQLTCFMEDIKGSYNSRPSDYGWKLFLQKQLLSKISNQDDIRITHLGAIPGMLCDQKVFIILDEVDDLKQLEALANKPNWFGPGSRIIVITENQKLLKQHGINHTYHVDFPTKEEAHKILCSYAFRSSLAPYGFEKLVERVTKLCSNLPLGLSVIGSSLLRMGEDDWESILHRLGNSLDPKISEVLRVGYDSLDKDDQVLFLLIAFFFNYEDEDHMKTMLGDGNLDVRFGLKNLKSKSLIQISTKGEIVMHKLLQQVGIEENQRQNPGKRQILTDPYEICDVLENKSDSRCVMGISFDISTLQNDVFLSARAVKKMRTLRFLKIYKTREDTNHRVHVPKDMNFPEGLKLFDWTEYPEKCLPHTFKPQNLVELNLSFTNLEKLWEGSQPLTNLKKMNLNGSAFLEKLPDLSVATNLERLDLGNCYSLVEISSYIGSLHKLEVLEMAYCINLQVLPTHFDLASINSVDMKGCWKLRKLPDISTNISRLHVSDTLLEELLGSIMLWSHLQVLHIWGSVNQVPALSILDEKRRGLDIEKIPDCIKDLHGLKYLEIYGCPKLASLPEFPRSLETLIVSTCESLETLMSFPSDSKIDKLYFTNCFKLGEEARRVITQQSTWACLPGRNIPAEFDHRVIGNSLTIPFYIKDLRICVVISPKQKMVKDVAALWCRLSRNGSFIGETQFYEISNVKTEHLYIVHFDSPFTRDDGEVLWEFKSPSQDIEIIECGFQILTDQADRSRSSQGSHKIPAEFDHQTIRNSLTIPSKTQEFRLCVVISPKKQMVESADLLCRISIYGIFFGEQQVYEFSNVQTEHLYIKHFKLPVKMECETLMEFSSSSQDIEIIECGLQILTDQTEGSRSNEESYESRSEQVSDSKLLKAWVRGRNIPAEFDHRAIGNSLIIPSNTDEFKVCLVISPKQQMVGGGNLLCRLSTKGIFVGELKVYEFSNIKMEHLYIEHFKLPGKTNDEQLWEYSSSSQDIEIIECGLQILTEQTEGSRSNEESYESRSEQVSDSKLLKAWVRGRNIPAEFDHRAIGNSLIIPSNTDEFKVCVVISPKQQMVGGGNLLCRLSTKGIFVCELKVYEFSNIKTEHLYIHHFKFPGKTNDEQLWEYSSSSQDIDIVECGLQILTDQTGGRRIKKVVMCLISGVVLFFLYFLYRYTVKRVSM